MRRIAAVATSSLMWLSLLATRALAQYPPSKPPPSGGPAGPGGQGGEGVAFTGASISLGIIILIALVIIGVLLWLAGRRRSRMSSIGEGAEG
jgi:hypothetical protein